MRWNFHQKKVGHSQADRPLYKNPLFSKSNWQLFIIERISFFGWLTILFFIVIIYLIFYSPLLQINRVEISGTKNISAKILEERFISWQFQQKRFKIFPQRNILMFSRKWLADSLARDYSLASLKVEKSLPHTIRLTLAEKTPELVWVTNNTYFFLGENGEIASAIADQNQASTWPAIIDDANAAAKPGQAVLTGEKVAFIKDLIKQIKEITTLEVAAYRMPNSLSSQLNVQTKAGYFIYFDTSKVLETQIIKLKRLLDDPIITEKPPLEYIDVRLGDKVYYK